MGFSPNIQQNCSVTPDESARYESSQLFEKASVLVCRDDRAKQEYDVQ